MAKTPVSRLRHMTHGLFGRVRRRGRVTAWHAAQVVDLTGTGAPLAFVATASVISTGILTFTSQPDDGDTVTVGTVVYTFQTTLVANVANNVLIGAAATDSIDNLIAAMGLGAGGGTLYGKDNTSVVHPDVTVAAGTGDTMDVTARLTGADGDNIVTAESTATVRLEWTTAMAGGVDPIITDATHGFLTGEGPLVLTTTDTLPAGLSLTELYWVQVVDANILQLHTSKQAAINGSTPVDITDTGTGTHDYARPAELNSDIHEWNRQASAEAIVAVSDIDSL